MVAARDEAPEWNPLAQPPGAPLASRIYGPAPGCYGAGEGNAESYLAASAHAYAEGGEGRADRAGFAARVATADALLHVQDHAETDVLDGPERARTRPVSPLPPPAWVRGRRCGTPIRPAPMRRASGRSPRRWHGWRADARPTRYGSRG